MLSRRLFTTSSLSLLFVTACTRTSAPPAHAKYGAFGLDLTNRDLSVKPGADFDAYCNGTWYKNNPFPADRSRFGWDTILSDQADADVKELVLEVAQRGGAPGSGGGPEPVCPQRRSSPACAGVGARLWPALWPRARPHA